MSYEIPNLRAPREDLLTGGQPTLEALQRLENAGFDVVVNLRGPKEFHDYNESAQAQRLGFNYYSIPIASAADLNRENVRMLDQILDKHSAQQILVHCASGNRVGALFALRAGWLRGKPTEEALAIGRAYGLTGLTPQVRELLETNL